MVEGRPRPAPLDRTGVVVTRPAHQADGLIAALEKAGARVYRFPVIGIAPPADERRSRRVLERLAEFDLIVFISANAVERGMSMIQAMGGLPEGLGLAAVGAATARALEARGLRVDLVPESRFDSEALLGLAALQGPAIAARRVLIVRGEGGRDVLGETLRTRGAIVDYAEVYRRVRPPTPPRDLLEPLTRGEVDIIVVTSGEGLRNLLQMAGEVGEELLVQTPLLVVSQRIAELALAMGWRAVPVVAPEASDAAVLGALAAWRAGRVRPGRGMP